MDYKIELDVPGSVVGKKGQLKNRVLGKKVEFYHNQLSK